MQKQLSKAPFSGRKESRRWHDHMYLQRVWQLVQLFRAHKASRLKCKAMGAEKRTLYGLKEAGQAASAHDMHRLALADAYHDRVMHCTRQQLELWLTCGQRCLLAAGPHAPRRSPAVRLSNGGSLESATCHQCPPHHPAHASHRQGPGSPSPPSSSLLPGPCDVRRTHKLKIVSIARFQKKSVVWSLEVLYS